MLKYLRCGSVVTKASFSLPNGYNGELEDEINLDCPKCGGLTIDEVKFVNLKEQP